MTDHPITPPPELVKEWIREANHNEPMFEQVAKLAAEWGSDMELEACCEWLVKNFWLEPRGKSITNLRAARRPKTPSLKEQALQALDEAVYMADDIPPEGISTEQADIIRRALESLPDNQ